MRNYLKLGDWNAICDVCGFKFKASQMRKRWDGMMTCHTDWEPRHPQDFLRAVPDNPGVPWSRPELPDVFVSSNGTPLTDHNLDIITTHGNAPILARP